MNNLNQVTFVESYFNKAKKEREKAKVNYAYYALPPETFRHKYPILYTVVESERSISADRQFVIDPFESHSAFLMRLLHADEIDREIEVIDNEISLEKLFDPIQ